MEEALKFKIENSNEIHKKLLKNVKGLIEYNHKKIDDILANIYILLEYILYKLISLFYIETGFL